MTTNAVMAGAIVLGAWAVGVYFLKFWRRSGDRLFGILGIAFWLLGVERLVLAFVPPEQDGRHLIFIVRLIAFLLIIGGIVDKNRARRPRAPQARALAED